MKKIFLILMSVFLAQTTFATEGVEMNPKDAIREIKEIFLNYSTIKGQYGNRACTISLETLESVFNGLSVEIKGYSSRAVSVEIATPDTKVIKYKTRGSYGTRYDIIEDGVTSSIVFQGYEDMSDFDLFLGRGSDMRIARCSYRE